MNNIFLISQKCVHCCRILRRKQLTRCLTGNIRTFLSPSYFANEEWKKWSLTKPVTEKDTDSFLLGLNTKYESTSYIAGHDIDILAQKMDALGILKFDIAIALFQKHRKCRGNNEAIGSTAHALIRTLLRQNDIDVLLQVTSDRVNYGIFYDDYTSSFTLDHLLKQELWQDAAAVAYNLMLDEDFSHPVKRVLSWYACARRHETYEDDPAAAAQEEVEGATENRNEEEEEEEEEAEWISVRVIANPYYDDHFDIPRETMKLGKTLAEVTRYEDFDPLLSGSFALIGWARYEKFEEGLRLMGETSRSSGQLARSAVADYGRLLENHIPRERGDFPAPGLIRLHHLYPCVTSRQKANFLEQYLVLYERLEEAGKLADVDLIERLEKKVVNYVSVMEKVDVAHQVKLFQKWAQQREEAEESANRIKTVEQRKKDLATSLVEIQKKEQQLNYFHELGKIKLGISRAPEIDEEVAEADDEVYVAAPGERGKKSK